MPKPKISRAMAKRMELVAATPEIVLTSVSQLSAWAIAAGVIRSPVRLSLKLSALSHQEQSYWQDKMAHSYNDCGCAAGAISMFALIVAAIVYGAVIGFEQSLWLIAPGTIVAAIVALFAGKLAGLAWSRRTLRREVAQIVQLAKGRRK